MTTRPSITGWREKTPSKKERLRALLSDGCWHGQAELVRDISHRFGAVLFSLHRESDNPVHYERRTNDRDDSIVHYRIVPDALAGKLCSVCSSPHRRDLKSEVRELRSIARELADACAAALPHHQGGHSDVGQKLKSALESARVLHV